MITKILTLSFITISLAFGVSQNSEKRADRELVDKPETITNEMLKKMNYKNQINKMIGKEKR